MRKIVILGLVTSSLFSLTLKDAIERGVANSSLVKNAQYTVKSRDIDVSIANGSFHPSINATYSHTSRDEAIGTSDKSYDVLSITASINLFNGMGDYFNKLSAIDNLEVAKLEKRATIADLKLSITNNYINHLNAKMEEKNQKASLELLQEQYKTAKLQLEQGIIARDELLKVEVNMLSVEKDLLRAKKEVKTSWFALKRSLGGNLETSEELKEPKLTNLSSYNYNDLKEKMYTSRSELKALEFTQSATKNSQRSVEGDYLPQADLSLTHNIYEEEKKSGTIITQPKDETITKLTLSWNLYNGQSTTNTSEKLKYSRLIVEENLRDLKLNLEYQLEASYEDLGIARTTLKVATKGKNSALESYNAVREKYREGIANNTELLDAREDLTKASSDLNSARYNLLLSNAKLQRVIGE